MCEDVHVDGAVERDATDVEEARRLRPDGVARIGGRVEEVYGGIYPAVMFFLISTIFWIVVEGRRRVPILCKLLSHVARHGSIGA